VSSPVDVANTQRWDGARPGHYEVWYLTCDHAASDTSYWIRYTMESPLPGHGEPYACLWFARFDARRPDRTFGVHRRFPIASMVAAADPFAVTIAASTLTSASARGELAGNGHAMAWNLTWPAATAVHSLLPDVMYRRGGLGETTVYEPNFLVPVSGTITVDGETLHLAGEPGGQTHLWGKKHAFAWAWGRCTFRDRPDAVLEALSVRLRRRGVTLPMMTLVSIQLGDERIAMNQFRHVLVNRGSWDTGRFTFRAANATTRISCELACRPDDMIVAPYVDPDGEPSYCANTEAGTGRLTIWRRRGLGWAEDVTLFGRAHFEVGSRTRDPAVTKDHVLVE
jgi:hypothetical protein